MRRLTLAAALALAAGAASAQSSEVEVLPPGPGQPQLVLARRPGRTASIQITFAAGSVDDGGLVGLTRLAQHALLVGNQALDHPALLTGVYASAGRLDVETGLRTCSFRLTADHRDFAPLARRLATALLAPRLDGARLKEVRAHAVLDAREKGGRLGALSWVASLVVEDGRYLNPTHGNEATLHSLTVADLERHLAGPLAPANATVVVTGRFDRDEMLRFLDRFSGGKALPVERPALAVPFRKRVEWQQELYLLGHRLEPRDARDVGALRLATALLDETLWTRFRQAGLAYGYSVAPHLSPWLDLLLVTVPAQDAEHSDLTPILQQAVELVRGGRYDDAQLERARGAALARLAEEERDPAALAAELSSSPVTWRRREVAEAVRRLDRAALTAAVEPWLSKETAIQIYLGPRM
ncbi:MAG: insulinase family protein [Anaeromyxobacteraceae bacterium]|nr:insulinase family protein [Anaeromyxobacteraceae bacterium]